MYRCSSDLPADDLFQLAKRRLDRQHSSSSDPQLALAQAQTSSDASEAESDAAMASAKVDDDLLPFKYQQVSRQFCNQVF